MKILLDECVPRKLKRELKEFEVYTVAELEWDGIKNDKLLSLMVAHHFDVLLSIDKNLKHQQNMQKFEVTIVILNVVRSKIELMKPLLPQFRSKLSEMKKHKIYEIK